MLNIWKKIAKKCKTSVFNLWGKYRHLGRVKGHRNFCFGF